jgi:hypothetical protein
MYVHTRFYIFYFTYKLIAKKIYKDFYFQIAKIIIRKRTQKFFIILGISVDLYFILFFCLINFKWLYIDHCFLHFLILNDYYPYNKRKKETTLCIIVFYLYGNKYDKPKLIKRNKKRIAHVSILDWVTLGIFGWERESLMEIEIYSNTI